MPYLSTNMTSWSHSRDANTINTIMTDTMNASYRVVFSVPEVFSGVLGYSSPGSASGSSVSAC